MQVTSPGSSPHTRGAPRLRIPRYPGCRIIPAYAGSTPWGLPRLSPTSDHPRIRGEHRCVWMAPMTSDGSSPHTRGARLRHRCLLPRLGIIPAYAGSTRVAAPRCFWPWDHPRIRGEHDRTGSPVMPTSGSSPHTRGARPLRPPPSFPPRDHPRIRGEHCCVSVVDVDCDGSSPHTRGARTQPAGARQADRIIPAYAGSTRWPRSDPYEPKDHPRIRGEHLTDLVHMHTGQGSSPHTRGARTKSRIEIRSE